jgi:hypothetical protein
LKSYILFNKEVRYVWNKKKFSNGDFKWRRVWKHYTEGECTSMKTLLKRMYDFNTKELKFEYTDDSQEEILITDKIYKNIILD